MQITIAGIDLTPRIRGHYPVFNLTINGTRLVQTVAGLRAEDIRHFDRGNRETVISFSTYREHKNVEDAHAFALIHETEAPTQGLLVLTANFGSKVVKRWVENAVLPKVLSTVVGIVTFHSYEIRGGGVLSTEPTPA